MELKRYRWTAASVDVPFLLGAIGAYALSGPALVMLLGGLGRTESAARNLLTRMRELGLLEVESQGRTNVYRLAGPSMSRYREVEGTSGTPVWTGSFAALVHQVPESQRTLRDRLVHQAHNAGYGQLRAGVLIATSDRWDRLRMDESEFSGEAWIYRTTMTPRCLDQAVTIARTAWDLPELERAYARALARCGDVAAVVEPTWALMGLWRELYDVFLRRSCRIRTFRRRCCRRIGQRTASPRLRQRSMPGSAMHCSRGCVSEPTRRIPWGRTSTTHHHGQHDIPDQGEMNPDRSGTRQCDGGESFVRAVFVVDEGGCSPSPEELTQRRLQHRAVVSQSAFLFR